MKSIRQLVIVCFSFFLFQYCYGQDTYRIGFRPNLSVKAKLNDDWSIITEYEYIEVLRKGYFNSDIPVEKKNLVELEFSALVQKKISADANFTGGYIYSFLDQSTNNELVQQLSITKKYNGLKVNHRIRVDETFGSEIPLRTRLRYRLAPIVVLSGSSQEHDELFLNLQNEYIYFVREGTNAFEFRVAPLLGYQLGSKNKVEAGLDGRAFNIQNKPINYIFWGRLNWYYTF